MEKALGQQGRWVGRGQQAMERERLGMALVSQSPLFVNSRLK